MIRIIALALGVIPITAMANFVEFGTTSQRHQTVTNASAQKIRLKMNQIDTLSLEALYADLEYKEWPLKDSRLDKNGLTANMVGYYFLDNHRDWFASTQLQLSNSNLFPKSTVYQEVSYRFGDYKNILFGVGLGLQDYYDYDSDVFFKIGPVWYFSGGATGYKYGRHTSTGSWLNSLFIEYLINQKTKVNAKCDFGEGYWDTQYLSETLASEVKTIDAEVKLTHNITGEFALYGTYGRTVMDDKVAKNNSLTSNNIGIGAIYSWK